MGRNMIETVMGAVVLAVAAFFLIFAYTHANIQKIDGYEITGTFASVGGLDTGADVKINGIKVGTVLSQTLDPNTYDAVVKMTVAHGIQLPADTVASISSEGLLGGKFIKLTPGKGKAMLAAGGTLGPTKNFKSLEEMVGQLIFLATADNQSTGTPAPAPQ